jgi:putative Mn2+ efflux pump MntP
MNLLVILGIAAALAMDCFAVSMGMAVGLSGLSTRQALRMGFFFGLFQAAMVTAGWAAGDQLLRIIRDFDHWVAFGLLAFIGGRMIFESVTSDESEKADRRDQTRGGSLILLSFATSIDSLAVGLGLGIIQQGILLPAAVIGAVSFLMTLIGARLGPVVGRVVGKRAEILGGLILLAIGIRILVEHL